MKITPKKIDNYQMKIIDLFSNFISILLTVLLGLACIGIGLGIFEASVNLITNFGDQQITNVLERLIIDMIVVVAIVEVARLIIKYLRDHSVDVEIIIETALVILLNELIREYFEHGASSDMLILVGVIAALMALRFGAYIQLKLDKNHKLNQ